MERVRPRVLGQPDSIGPRTVLESLPVQVEVAATEFLLQGVHAPNAASRVLSQCHSEVIATFGHRHRLRPDPAVLAPRGHDPVFPIQVVAIALDGPICSPSQPVAAGPEPQQGWIVVFGVRQRDNGGERHSLDRNATSQIRRQVHLAVRQIAWRQRGVACPGEEGERSGLRAVEPKYHAGGSDVTPHILRGNVPSSGRPQSIIVVQMPAEHPAKARSVVDASVLNAAVGPSVDGERELERGLRPSRSREARDDESYPSATGKVTG